MSLRIACVGAGPGGLFFALLAKRGDPTREVTVFERNRAQDAFGFGVVFSDATLARIDEADPVLRTALTEHGVHWDAIEVRLKGESHRAGGNGMAAVARRTLLALLQQRAAEEGVDLRFCTEVDPGELLAAGYDLVVAADGAGSRLRAHLADSLAPSAQTASAKFIWFGTTYPFPGLTFVHERGPDGVFAVHGYPIGGGVSTFIVETDEPTWRAAGLDEFDTTAPPGSSDDKSRAYLEKLFAPTIEGAPLLVNNSRWGSFRTLRAGAWHARVAGGSAVALLGDAAHTAHFSVGSGTKMAMEDAVALAAALDRHPGEVDAALAHYQGIRAPEVARIQGSARPSLSWWEHFGRTHDALEPWQFAYHFLSRSLPDAKLRRRDPDFVEATHAAWRERHGAEPLDTPLRVGPVTVPGRLVDVHAGADHASVALGGQRLPLLPGAAADGGDWGLWLQAPDEEADLGRAVGLLAAGLAAGAALVAVGGGSALTRRLLSEAARLEHGAVTLLVEDTDPDTALTAVLSGRADLVGVPVGVPVGDPVVPA